MADDIDGRERISITTKESSSRTSLWSCGFRSEFPYDDYDESPSHRQTKRCLPPDIRICCAAGRLAGNRTVVGYDFSKTRPRRQALREGAVVRGDGIETQRDMKVTLLLSTSGLDGKCGTPDPSNSFSRGIRRARTARMRPPCEIVYRRVRLEIAWVMADVRRSVFSACQGGARRSFCKRLVVGDPWAGEADLDCGLTCRTPLLQPENGAFA